MAVPSEKLTTQARETLGEAVTIAVRIKPGKASRLKNPFVRSAVALLFTVPYLAVLLIKKLLSPVVASFRAPAPRVLAFMADGGYRLLSAGAKREMRAFSSSARLRVHPEQFEAVLLAEITIDDFTCVINGVDLKPLLRATIAGEVSDSELEKLARIHQRYASSILANQELSTLRHQQGLAEPLSDPVE